MHVWADANLDEEIKELLAHYDKGSEIPLDIVAHMEYFYNTLECHFKVEDPFKFPMKYPALSYCRMEYTSGPSSNEKTLYERHKEVIFPNSGCKVTQSQTTNSEEPKLTNSGGSKMLTGSGNSVLLKFSKQYTWYPNGSIASPSKFHVSQTPTPKTISTQRRGSGISGNPFAKFQLNPMAEGGFGECMENY